ncbi:MAG: L-2-amino-thiazoline-4-carboxylic acid hydrolase [Pseudomonadota bacterium]
MTTFDRLPVLERRRIQAEVIKPIYEAMVSRIGEDTAREILGGAIKNAAIAEGRRFAERDGEEGGLQGFVDMQHLWEADGALETEVVEHTDTTYAYKVNRCRYAEMYRDMGMADIGFLLSCNRDGTFCEGYDPNLKLTRKQTLMQGDDHCDFHYRLHEER